ncbi:SCO7613 C-terminal domain-containing membrane protein [Streptomyces sp. NPDC059477]|uniref:SCO7613 C-terminal domain-containing membrane protein n=1 Tax=Streptomyces sp. NPDC059477 TaxID=3346847 RepID=UPI0036BD6CCE
MTQIPPPAEELRLLDAELSWLDGRRSQLLARRAWLVAQLHGAPSPRTAAPPPMAPWSRPSGPAVAAPEASTPGVQNLLLLLGGALLTLAAVAFTLVSWGDLGIAGRAVVLGAVTAAALVVPVALLKRGLRSTAESVAGLGLALTVLDAYALHEVALADTDGTGYAAVVSAVLAAGWAAYGRGLARVSGPALRLPVPAAVCAAQLPLLLWAVTADALPYGVTTALLVTAALDAIVALRCHALTVRVVAATGAYGMGGWGVLAAGWLSWTADGPGAAARAAALLLLAASIALIAAWRSPAPGLALGLAVTGGLLTVAAVAGVPRVLLPEAWFVPVHLVFGMALLAASRVGRIPEPIRHGLAWASAGVQGMALLWALPMVAAALMGPVGRLGSVWDGAPGSARLLPKDEVPWAADVVTAPVVLLMVAALLVVVVRDATWRPRALEAALGLVWATLLLAPHTLRLPYVAALLLLVAMTVGLLALRGTRSTVLALVTSADLALLALAAEPATLVVLAFLTALFTLSALAALPARSVRLAFFDLGALRPVPAVAALVYATGLACASGASLGWAPEHIALLVLLVSVAAAGFAARVEGGTQVAVEIAGGAAALVAVGLAVTDLPMLALVIALCGVIASGTALRPERRPAGWVATGLFVVATWVRLAAWEVEMPEAYTLPVTVPALLIGWLLRHGDPRTSSWVAYGPGLAVTLVPSLAMAWDDPHWQRPLLLGVAALVITLVGARGRLLAPLVLGGSVLLLITLHELAPYLVQVAGLLPRWAPPALAGLLLLALGATYERRLREVRRVRDVLGKMD